MPAEAAVAMLYSNPIHFQIPLKNVSITYLGAEKKGDKEVLSIIEQAQSKAQNEILDGVFRKLSSDYNQLIREICDRLPDLIFNTTKKVLNGIHLDESQVKEMILNLIKEYSLDKEKVEVFLSEEDFNKLKIEEKDSKKELDGLIIYKKSFLNPKDCQIKSQFGLFDSRSDVKLDQIKNNIS